MVQVIEYTYESDLALKQEKDVYILSFQMSVCVFCVYVFVCVCVLWVYVYVHVYVYHYSSILMTIIQIEFCVASTFIWQDVEMQHSICLMIVTN